MRLIFNTSFFAVIFLLISNISLNAQSTVYEAIRQNPDLQRLEEAINNTTLRQRFSENGTFTIFAPTNAAMATIPTSILNNPTLAEDLILTHAVNGFFRNFDLVDDAAVHTINNRDLIINRNGNGLFINGAEVIVTDIITGNGVVHIIDTWIPKSRTSETTLWSIIDRSPKHRVLSTIIRESDMEDLYLEDELKTVFIPTDDAFFALSDERFDELLGGNLNYINNILEFHIVEQDILFADLLDGAQFTAANMQELTISITFNGTFVNNARIQFSAITASNGRVYVIEKVLLPEDLPPFTFVDFVTESEDHTSLENAITSADLVDDLSAEGSRTYFAPTDEAFDKLDPEFLSDLFADQDSLRNVILNHVLGERNNEEDLIDLEMVSAINGYELTIDEFSNGVFVDNALITIEDIPVDNGIVHVIDAVLVEIIEPFTVYDIISTHDSLALYDFFVLKDNYDDTLNQVGPYTVFAPTDNAINMMPESFLDDLNSMSPTLLDELVRSHIIDSLEPSDSLAIDTDFFALNNFGLTIGTDTLGNLFLNQSRIVVRDLFADNGVVHIIDAVVNPIDTFVTIYDFVQRSPTHTTLAGLMNASSIRNVFETPGAITFFAPTDEAFDNLPANALNEIFGDPNGLLIEVLLRHTVTGNQSSSDLEILSQITNSNLENLEIEVINGDIFINGAKIIVRDIILDNGIVHVVDAIIGEGQMVNTVFDVISNSENLTELESLIVFADFDDVLREEENITFFAPTNSAFAALPQGFLAQLASINTDFLLDVLNFHKHDNLVLANSLINGSKLLMANGEEVSVEIVNNEIFINNAKIVFEDLIADNGIVHVIDAVIMAPIDLPNVYEIVSTENNLTIMKNAVDAAGLDDELIDETDITLFAPTDEAFMALPDGVLDDLLANVNLDLEDALLNHKHNQILLSSDFVNGERILMANGEETTITLNASGAFIDNALIVVTDIEAENGVVHLIDAVLYTPPEETFTVYDIVAENTDLTFLDDAIVSADLRSTLDNSQGITLFAPTNEAFNALSNETLTEFFNDPMGILRNTLLNHLHNNELSSNNLGNGQLVSMSGGNTSVISIGNGLIRIDDAILSVRDLQADNGIVHIIDEVLTFSESDVTTVYDIVVESPDHSILEKAINDANLVGELNGDNFVTLFAPTNSAFNNLPSGLFAQLNSDPNGMLRNLLLRHISKDQINSNNFVNGEEIEVSNGEEIVITIFNNEIFFGSAKIVIEDIQADNGVVHVLDAVALPESLITTVFDIISDSPNHTLLEELLILSGLDVTLSSSFGEFTVFAPNDNAITNLGSDEIESLTNDPNGALRDLLLYHVTTSDIAGVDLTNGREILMANGINAVITNDGFNSFIQDAWILQFDITADNGRVHIVNNVVSPITSTKTLNEEDFRFYPNPVTDELTIDWSDTTSEFNVVNIYNSLGERVKSLNINSSKFSINVSDMVAGIYFLEIDNFRSNNLRFIKN